MNCKLVKFVVSYKDKNGEDKKGYNFGLMLDNGRYLACKPSFKEDYKLWSVIAEEYKR